MKTPLKCILLVFFAAAFCVGMRFVASESRKARDTGSCRSLEVKMMDTLRFFKESDIREVIDTEYGPFIGQKINDVNVNSIENALRSKAHIEDVEVWITDDGVLHIMLWQRMPSIRLAPAGRSGCYIDRNGQQFPLAGDFTVDVPVISGDIPDSPGTITDLLEFVRISQKEGWIDKYSAILMDNNGDISFRLEGMDEQFIVGSVSDLEGKLSRISVYINRISEMNLYSTVSVKYSNQIICRKKDILQPQTSGHRR